MSKEGDAHNALTRQYGLQTGAWAGLEEARKGKYGKYVDGWMAANTALNDRFQAEQASKRTQDMLAQQYQQQVQQQQKLEPLLLEEAGFRLDPATNQYVRTDAYNQQRLQQQQQQESYNQLLQQQLAAAKQQGEYSARYMEELYPQLLEGQKTQAEIYKQQMAQNQAYMDQVFPEILNQQRQMSERQQREFDRARMLEPFMLEDMGLIEQRDEAGNITGYAKRPKTEQELLEEQLYNQSLDRYRKALAGELEVSPTLTRGLQEEEAAIQEQMRRNLGTGWETSSAGIETMAEWGKRKNETLENARRGEIDLYGQIALGQGQRQSGLSSELANRRQQGTNSYQYNPIGNMGELFGQGQATGGSALGGFGALGGMGGGYGAAQAGYGATLGGLYGGTQNAANMSGYGDIDVGSLIGANSSLLGLYEGRRQQEQDFWNQRSLAKQGKKSSGGIGRALGGIAGGILGSYFPVVGTAVGASIGGAIGGAF